jgi:hypothetical protein
MSLLKAIMKFFSKSTYGKTKLKEEQNMARKDKPVKALQKIGKAQFDMHWTAANTLDSCLGNIRQLVINKTIHFKVKLHVLITSTSRKCMLTNIFKIKKFRACS